MAKNNRKEKLNLFKQKQRKMAEQKAEQLAPEVRQIPVWNSQSEIVLNGLEFQAIYESMAAFQQAAMVLQNVVSKGILGGQIRLDFEKLDPETNQYVPMTDEEKVPYQEELVNTLDVLRKAQADRNAGVNTESASL